jgi:hypothetical protein
MRGSTNNPGTFKFEDLQGKSKSQPSPQLPTIPIFYELNPSFVISRLLLVIHFVLMDPLENQHCDASCQDHQCHAAAIVQQIEPIFKVVAAAAPPRKSTMSMTTITVILLSVKIQTRSKPRNPLAA